MKRQLRIDMTDLELAFESSREESDWYLNVETGEVILVPGDVSSLLESVKAEVEENGVDFAQALADSDAPDWEKEVAVQAAYVEEHEGDTVIYIPEDETSEAFRDMRDFAASVRNDRIADRLLDALSGNRPFRRFKDAITHYPAEEKRWFEYRDAQLRQRILDWLDGEGIEPIFDK